MRTQVRLYSPFQRDLSWISQEFLEDYAGSKIRGGEAPAYCISKWTAGDTIKANVIKEVVDSCPDFLLLQEELIEEFGLEYFIGKPRDKLYHIRQLEQEIERAVTPEDKAKLYKELREYQGWTSKPAEKSLEINNYNNGIKQNIQIDRTNAAEVERAYMSFLG